jgi:formylglycine-generating enzyme required for sulfatase activity
MSQDPPEIRLKKLLENGLITETEYNLFLQQARVNIKESNIDGSVITGRVEAGGDVVGRDKSTAEGNAVIAQGEGHKIAINGGQIVEQHFHGSPPTNYSQMRENYLTSVFSRCNRLSLSGVDQQVAGDATHQLDLNQVYTGLHTTASERTYMRREMLRDNEPRQIPALEQLNKHGRLVLLGDPGSGKSAFVNFVALCLAGELLGKPEANIETLIAPLPVDDEEKEKDKKPQPQPWHQGNLFPVVVILRDLAARGLPPAGQPANASHLKNFVIQEVEGLGLDGYGEQLWADFTQKGLLLLDGLDEVPSADERRVQIKQMVQSVAQTYGKVRILVTSRTYAYQKQDWRLEGFQEALLAPFGWGQIRSFVRKWYTYVGLAQGLKPEDSQGRAVILNDTIRKNERLLDFAKRPLLLTLMASLHAWRGGTLPDDRQKLYEQSVELLLDWWQQQKKGVDKAGKPVIDQPKINELLGVSLGQVRRVLNRLAYEAHSRQVMGEEETTADIPEKELLNELQEISQKPLLRQDLEECVRERTGLLIPRGGGVYAFPHRTFQEYLAACHLTDDNYPDKLAGLAKDEPQRWREVVQLAGAKASAGSTSGGWNLVEALCEDEPTNPTVPELWGGQLAGQLLAEVVLPNEVLPLPGRNQKKLARVKKWLGHILQGGQLPVLERAGAGLSLAKLGDERPEVMTVEGMEFCYVPPGSFWMGNEQGDKDEKPAGEVNIPYPYFMGRLPVTNAQFNEFIEAGGYQNHAYWPEAIKEKFWTTEGFKGRYDNKPRQKPEQFRFPFGVGNHPVVGVTWYEARAFCHWLTERWQSQLPQGWAVRLPTEAEWEKVARGGAQIPQKAVFGSVGQVVGYLNQEIPLKKNVLPQRLYLWGKEWVQNYVNNDKSEVGNTMAAGGFAQVPSVYGCQELAGQVWEWTQTIYKSYPYQRNDGREAINQITPNTSVCLRGGSWGNNSNANWCSFRDRDSPHDGYNDRGFRVRFSPTSFSVL